MLHRPTRPRLAAAALCGAVLGLLLCRGAFAEKGLDTGEFRDAAGSIHSWSVERSHLLLWENKPYVPAGVVFRSAYLKSPGDAALREDADALDRLRSAGVNDLWIEPQKGLLEDAPEVTQRLIDAVESRGFRYGLRIGDRSRQPLIGFSPNLPAQRVPAAKLKPGAVLTWTIQAPRGKRAIYNLVETGSDERVHNYAIAAGDAVVEKDEAEIQVRLRNSRLLGRSGGLLIAVPEVQVDPSDLGSYGELWDGMDEYQERLTKYLQALKLGPGFRFILDPFTSGDGTVGQEDLVFPSSDAFRAAFEEWLKKRTGILTLNTAWRTGDKQVPGFEEAARVIPMWPRNDPPDGDGWLYDPVDQVAYRCTPSQSSIWKDLDDFRAETLKRWMNAMATAVKEHAVNVPVLYSWAAFHPVFTNSPSPSGYDGLGAQLYGAPERIAEEKGAFVLAQAEESDRNAWLVATRLAGPLDKDEKPAPLTDRAQLQRAWDSLKGAGIRGFYLDPAQVPEAASLAGGIAPTLTAGGEELRKPVQAVFFPMPLATERLTRFSNGVWWLPSVNAARLVRYGDSVTGYEIVHPFGMESPVQKSTVLWSTTGTRDLSFFLSDKLVNLQVFDTAGTLLKPRKKKGQMILTLGAEPLILAGAEAVNLFPIEMAINELKEFDTLLKQAEAKRLNAGSLRAIWTEAGKQLKAENAAIIYNQIAPYVTQLRQVLTPYIWVEGERPGAHNFAGIAFQAGCSAGTYLKLDRADPPVSGVYKARYTIELRQQSSYEVWVAGRVPGRGGASPLIWQVDDEPATVTKTAEPVGAEYAGGMAWFNLGRLALNPGKHELLLVIPERGENGRYLAGVDAIVLSRDPFRPNGITKPYVTAMPLAPSPAPGKPEKPEKPEKPASGAPAGAAPASEK